MPLKRAWRTLLDELEEDAGLVTRSVGGHDRGLYMVGDVCAVASSA